MSMTVGELKVVLSLDDSQFNRGLDQVHGKLDRSGGQMEGKFGKAGAVMGTAFKRGAIVAGAGVAGLVGTALVKGFQRLSSIENATAKLKGLGHSAADVQLIMDNALASVKGTAFGLDEAAMIAATTVAAGVKPGQQLEKTLRLVADAATIGGTSLGEMGAVFNKVAASNKMQGDVMAQLNDAGIPIQQFLAKSLGVTTDKVYELSKAGTISFPVFAKAMEKGLGGAALASGNTATGAFKNVMAALSRLGASALSGIFPSIPAMFNQIGALFDRLQAKYGPILKAWGEKVAAGFKTGGIRGALEVILPKGMADDLISTFNITKDTTIIIVKVIGKIASVFVKLPDALQKFAIAAGALTLVLGKFGLLGSAKDLAGGLLGSRGRGLTGGLLSGAGTSAAGGAAAGVGIVPVAVMSIAAAAAGAIYLGVKAGQEEAKTGGSFWDQVRAGLAGPGDWFYKLAGGPQADKFIAKYGELTDRLAALPKTPQGADLKADYQRAMYVPQVKAAIELGTPQTRAQLAVIRAAIVENLNVPIKEATRLTQLIFPQSWAGRSKMDIKAATDELANLKEELRKKQRWGAPDTGATVAAIKAVEARIEKMRANAARPVHVGHLDTSGWLGPLSAAARRIQNTRDLAALPVFVAPAIQNIRTHAPAPAPVWHAPGRAAGGFVPRTPGGTLFRVGEGKYDEVIAQVLPGGGRGQRTGGDVHVHIGQLVGTDERSARKLAEQVGQILMSKQRMKGAMARG